MSLIQKIDEAIKSALLAKDQVSLRGLRAIKSALLIAKTEKGGSEEISEETEIKILQKQVKQRRESAEIYRTQQREDLAKIEEEEISVIERYLPKQLEPEEVEQELRQLADEHRIKDAKDLGKLMGLATKHFSGKANGKTVSELAKKILSQ